MANDNARILRAVKRNAKSDHVCYGCGGECPIPAGDSYLCVTVGDGTTVKTLHYCQRCNMAIMSRIAFSKTHSVAEVDGGLFRWSRLSSSFRKNWTEMCKRLAEKRASGEDDGDVMEYYLDKLGYNKYMELRENAMNDTNKRTRGKTHPAQKKLTALRKQLREVALEIAGCLDKLTVEQLAAKVDAMMQNGDTSHNDKCTVVKSNLEKLLGKIMTIVEEAK